MELDNDHEMASASFPHEPLTLFHSDGAVSSCASVVKAAGPYDLLDFLAVAQHRRIDMLPFKWESGVPLGMGGTANVAQGASVEVSDGTEMGFVFKRVHRETSGSVYQHRDYQALLSEVYVLGHPVVRHHPNIIAVEGFCWDVVGGESWPVLVFKKTEHGDLRQFMCSKGKSLSFKARVKLCREIGDAVLLMHSCHAIHGDLKPENILIFRDVDGEFSAKVADFGFSTLFAEDSDRADVLLPTSWPWTAPDVEGRDCVTFAQAKSADIFSYGLVCMWLLSYGTMQEREGFDLSLIRAMKGEPDLTELAWATATNGAERKLEMEQDLALKVFFDASLSANSNKRRLLVDKLGRPFGSPGESRLLIDEYGTTSVSGVSASYFDLVGMFSQFRASGELVWQTVFRCLQKRVSHGSSFDEASRNLAAFQLAFCYRIGFAVEIDQTQSQYWLERSGIAQQDLNDAVDMITDDMSSMFKNIAPKVDFFDKEKNPSGGNTAGSSETLASPNADEGPSRDEVYLMGSVAAWMHKRLGIEPGEVRMTITNNERPETEEQTLANLHELTKDQFGWESGGSTAVKFNLNLDLDTFSRTFPVETLMMQDRIAASETSTTDDEESRLIRSLDRKKKVLGPHHEDTLGDMDALAKMYVEREEWENAEPLVIHVMTTQMEKLGQPHPSTLKSMGRVVAICMLGERWKEAETLSLEMINTRRRVLGLKHPDTLETLKVIEHLIEQYKKGDRYEDCRVLLEYLLEFRLKAFGDDNEDTLDTMTQLAMLCILQDEDQTAYEKAEEWLTHVIEQRKKILGKYHPKRVMAMQLLAGLYRMHSDKPGVLTKIHELVVKIREAQARLADANSRQGASTEHDSRHPQCCEHQRDAYSTADFIGQHVHDFMQRSLNRAGLNTEVQQAEADLEAMADDSPDRSAMQARLAEALACRFEQQRDIDDLDLALVWAEQAVIVLPPNHPDQALRLEELSNMHWLRFENSNPLSFDDLDASLAKGEESVNLTSDDDPARSQRIEDLAVRFRRKHQEQENTDDLERAIMWAEQAALITSERGTRALQFVLVASWCKEKHAISANITDLSSAIEAFKAAENDLDQDDMRAQLHNELSDLYEERYAQHSHDPGDLNEAVRCAAQAAEEAQKFGSDGETLAGGEAAYGPLLGALAWKYLLRFENFKDPDDIFQAVRNIDLAAEIVPPESRNREQVMRVHGMAHNLQHVFLSGDDMEWEPASSTDRESS
ncbi:kinase-like protein [Thozetella sp. PMI_491]|nr:kinase-like protein [Thozetella sp. PMI_491]